MQKILGPEHPDTLRVINTLAVSLSNNGLQLGKALRLFDEANVAARKTLGDQHELAQITLQSLGITLNNAQNKSLQHLCRGNFEEAIKLLDAMLSYHGSYRDKVRDVPYYQILAEIGQRDWQAALNRSDSKLKEIEAEYINEAQTPNDKVALNIETLRAVCLLELSEFDKAEPIAKTTLENESAGIGSRARAKSVLAVCLAHKGESTEALNLIAEAYETLESQFAETPDHELFLTLRMVERAIQVSELSDEPDTKDELVNEWKQKAVAINDRIKAQVFRITTEEAKELNARIWPRVAAPPGLNSSKAGPLFEDELPEFRRLCEQHPSGGYINTLGVAEYRMGNYQEAIAAATESSKKLVEEMGLPSIHPSDLAILAASYYRLDEKDKANAFRKQLAEAMLLDAFKEDKECLSFHQEVRKLFSKPPESEKKKTATAKNND